MESTDHLNINALFCGLWLSLSLTHGQQDIWDTSELSVAFLGTVCSTADGTMGKKTNQHRAKTKALAMQRAQMPGQDSCFEHSQQKLLFANVAMIQQIASLLLSLHKSPSLLLYAQCGQVLRWAGVKVCGWGETGLWQRWLHCLSILCLSPYGLGPGSWNAGCRQTARAALGPPTRARLHLNTDHIRMGLGQYWCGSLSTSPWEPAAQDIQHQCPQAQQFCLCKEWRNKLLLLFKCCRHLWIV